MASRRAVTSMDRKPTGCLVLETNNFHPLQLCMHTAGRAVVSFCRCLSKTCISLMPHKRPRRQTIDVRGFTFFVHSNNQYKVLVAGLVPKCHEYASLGQMHLYPQLKGSEILNKCPVCICPVCICPEPQAQLRLCKWIL